jgi:hypothetical protein
LVGTANGLDGVAEVGEQLAVLPAANVVDGVELNVAARSSVATALFIWSIPVGYLPLSSRPVTGVDQAWTTPG